MPDMFPYETDLLVENPTINNTNNNTFEWTLTSTYVACWVYSFSAYSYYILLALSYDDISSPDKPRTSTLVPSSGVLAITKNGTFSIYDLSHENEYIIILSLCIDLFGQATILIASNYYTTMIKNTMRQKSISHGDILYISPDLIATTPHMWLYMVDIIFVNLCYILKVFTNLRITLILFEYRFPNMFFCERLLLFIFSFCIHSASVYLYINYVIDMKLETPDHVDTSIINRLFHFNRKKHFIVGILICIPILTDHYIIAFNTNNIVLSDINILTIYLIFFIVIYKPAYKWNNIILHFLLVFQSIILTNSHI
jgi:hypothetical protein